MAVQLIHSHLAALPSDYPADKAIREAVEEANRKITPVDKDHEVPQLRVGTAVIVALVRQEAEGPLAWIGHIGDCRGYLIRAGRLNRITHDHTAVQSLLNQNLITPQEAYRHPDAGVLTRSLGVQPEVEIEIEKHPLAVGDTLLLCSDGLWDAIPEKEIERSASDLTVESSAHKLLSSGSGGRRPRQHRHRDGAGQRDPRSAPQIRPDQLVEVALRDLSAGSYRPRRADLPHVLGELIRAFSEML